MAAIVRVGMGYDLHRLEKERKLILGGIEIESDKGLVGHSDADVLLHAIIDAMLGGAGMGDIGEQFPDTDPAYKDADSRELTRNVRARVQDAGFGITNVDVVIHAEAPKLMPHRARIRSSVAEILGLSETAVGVKATTNEGLGEIGRGEAMACWAAVLLHAVG